MRPWRSPCTMPTDGAAVAPAAETIGGQIGRIVLPIAIQQQQDVARGRRGHAGVHAGGFSARLVGMGDDAHVRPRSAHSFRQHSLRGGIGGAVIHEHHFERARWAASAAISAINGGRMLPASFLHGDDHRVGGERSGSSSAGVARSRSCLFKSRPLGMGCAGENKAQRGAAWTKDPPSECTCGRPRLTAKNTRPLARRTAFTIPQGEGRMANASRRPARRWDNAIPAPPATTPTSTASGHQRPCGPADRAPRRRRRWRRPPCCGRTESSRSSIAARTSRR